MKDQRIVDLIIARMDRIENKVDKLLEFKWKVTGVAIVVGGLVGIIARFL